MAMVPGHCRPAIGFEYSSHTCDAQTSIACSAPSKKREGPFLHAILAFPPFSSTVCALLASARAGCVCASSSPPFLTGGAPRQCIWPVAHGKGALSPLLPLPFPHLPLFTVICRPHPPPQEVVCSCNFSCFQTCGWCAQLTPSIARWWLFVPFLVLSTDVWGLYSDELLLDWGNGIVQWWLVISPFHDSCYLH
jgi:hypothetical protein